MYAITLCWQANYSQPSGQWHFLWSPLHRSCHRQYESRSAPSERSAETPWSPGGFESSSHLKHTERFYWLLNAGWDSAVAVIGWTSISINSVTHLQQCWTSRWSLMKPSAHHWTPRNSPQSLQHNKTSAEVTVHSTSCTMSSNILKLFCFPAFV